MLLFVRLSRFWGVLGTTVLAAGLLGFDFGFVFKGVLEGAMVVVRDVKRRAGPGRLSRILKRLPLKIASRSVDNSLRRNCAMNASQTIHPAQNVEGVIIC